MYTLYFIVHVDGRPNKIKSNQIKSPCITSTRTHGNTDTHTDTHTHGGGGGHTEKQTEYNNLALQD